MRELKASPGSPSPLRRVGYDVAAIAGELVGIPARGWMSAAEWAGNVVLAGARLAWPPLRALWRLFLAAVAVGARVITPARMTAVVTLCAAAALIGSQFVDYRAVQVGQPQYRAVESVAPAPAVASRDPRTAHGDWLIAIGAAAIVVVAVSYGRRWRLARLLILLGGAAVAVAVLHDHDAGLRAGQVGLDYQGASPVLLGGYWAEIVAGALLMACGPLLAFHLARAARAPDRRAAPAPCRVDPGEGRRMSAPPRAEAPNMRARGAERALPFACLASAVVLAASEFMTTFQFVPAGGDPQAVQHAYSRHH